ncbi:hypothetical protein WJX81_006514 [Elliptochloris bilobata]|uniref:COX assembly mitochondrial protein n=1 Tax=Elliptochloris bilobata TaxID=381761 RepID=A0AAW1QK46_9CHLO
MVKDQQQLVSRKVEEALLYRLKQKAMADCKVVARAYADCCSTRVFSAVWACRAELSTLNQCLQQHTGAQALNELKRRWVEAGRPDVPNWDMLLRGL